MLPQAELTRATLAYLKARRIHNRPLTQNDFFYSGLFYVLRWHVDHWVEGYPCPPCPNCGCETMWYRESTWKYDDNGAIEHGKLCERCNHAWANLTGEIWRQGNVMPWMSKTDSAPTQ